MQPAESDRQNKGKPSVLLQLVVSFIIPIIILTRFSGEDQLGPVRGLLLALAFPVALELYGMRKHKKPSIISLMAIGGILVTGAIGLLGLSEGWLAIRRTVPYAAAGAAFLISGLIGRPLLGALLPYLMNTEEIMPRAREKRSMAQLEKRIGRANYMTAALFMLLALISYVLTVWVIVGRTGTTAFNQEYARLRLLSLPAVVLPMIAGLTAILYYVVRSVEKLTDLEFDTILKKK